MSEFCFFLKSYKEEWSLQDSNIKTGALKTKSTNNLGVVEKAKILLLQLLDFSEVTDSALDDSLIAKPEEVLD